MTNKPLRKDTQATRKRLIDTAEHLFAELGVDNTSLLDIAKAADQKNRSALQYHFGDKTGLIHAVLDKHALGITLHRSQMLDQLELKKTYTLHDVIEALILPMTAMLNEKDGGVEFLKIHAQLMASDNYAALRKGRAKQFDDVRRLYYMLSLLLAQTDRNSLELRFTLIDGMLIHGLTSYLSYKKEATQKLFLKILINSIAAVLQQ